MAGTIVLILGACWRFAGYLNRYGIFVLIVDALFPVPLKLSSKVYPHCKGPGVEGVHR